VIKPSDASVRIAVRDGGGRKQQRINELQAAVGEAIVDIAGEFVTADKINVEVASEKAQVTAGCSSNASDKGEAFVENSEGAGVDFRVER
jgi:hypothetical protein